MPWKTQRNMLGDQSLSIMIERDKVGLVAFANKAEGWPGPKGVGYRRPGLGAKRSGVQQPRHGREGAILSFLCLPGGNPANPGTSQNGVSTHTIKDEHAHPLKCVHSSHTSGNTHQNK